MIKLADVALAPKEALLAFAQQVMAAGVFDVGMGVWAQPLHQL